MDDGFKTGLFFNIVIERDFIAGRKFLALLSRGFSIYQDSAAVEALLDKRAALAGGLAEPVIKAFGRGFYFVNFFRHLGFGGKAGRLLEGEVCKRTLSF